MGMFNSRGGGHASSMGMHGSTIPLYGAAVGGSAHQRNNNNNHHGNKSNATLIYVCFYHFLLLFLSISMGISLCT